MSRQPESTSEASSEPAVGLDEMLSTERHRLEARDRELRLKIDADTADLREVQDRLKHIGGLLGANDLSAVGPTMLPSRNRRLEDIAVEILRARKRTPMYYKDLAAEVQAHGGNLSGADPNQVLVARLVRDQRFVRPIRKGFYALREDYPKARNVGARKRRRRSQSS